MYSAIYGTQTKRAQYDLICDMYMYWILGSMFDINCTALYHRTLVIWLSRQYARNHFTFMTKQGTTDLFSMNL